MTVSTDKGEYTCYAKYSVDRANCKEFVTRVLVRKAMEGEMPLGFLAR